MVKQSNVLGQICPGIPYVIFPGNVGEEKTLREAVEILQG